MQMAQPPCKHYPRPPKGGQRSAVPHRRRAGRPHPTPHPRPVRPASGHRVGDPRQEGVDAMTEQRNGLSRALSAPVRRAMSRLLSPPSTAPIPASTSRDDSAVVDCAMYVDGVRQPGTWHYAEALAAARRHGGNAFVWIGLLEPGPDEFADIATTFKLHELAVEDAV